MIGWRRGTGPIVLVTGGRAYQDWSTVDAVLSAMGPSVVIHGAQIGADAMAEHWARLHLHPTNHYSCWPTRAEFREHGDQAFTARNQRMLDDHKPTLVLAFPGGSGTRDMIARAKRAGVPVLSVMS